MSRLDTLRKDLARLKDAEAIVRRDIGRHQLAAAKAGDDVGRHVKAALKTTSMSNASSHQKSAAASEKKVAEAQKKVAELTAKLARLLKELASKQSSISAAEKTEQRANDRVSGERRRKELSHARELAALSPPEVRYVRVREPKPEKLRILYLTANPEAIERHSVLPDGTVQTEGAWLRVDAEVREVKRMLKSALHRDLVHIEHLPAATLQDLMDGINDVRPHVIHFSGHAGAGGLLFENGSIGTHEGSDVPFHWLAEALQATDMPPSLLVMNACDTLTDADLILPAVPAVVAMSDSIGDAAAVIFASHFYRGIASAQSVGSALRQARFAMKTSAFIDDADLPDHVAREGLDIDAYVLVSVLQGEHVD